MKKLILLVALLPLLWVFSQDTAPSANAPSKQPSSPKIAEYRIVENSTTAGLAKLVNQALRNGWEPAGGLCCYSSSGVFSQAMIKRSERDP